MMEENLPPGFRFHPTDEELITYYLNTRFPILASRRERLSMLISTSVNLGIYQTYEWPIFMTNLLYTAKASMGEKEWYFFSLRDRKYPTGLRTNRATEAGYWKTTGKDKEIFRGGVLVGMKKTLVFYRGRAPKGEKTNWVMHEYRLETKLGYKPAKEEWVRDEQHFATELQRGGDLVNSNMNMNLNMNWPAAREATSNAINQTLSSWPSSLLNQNLSMNSLLLRALQLRSYQQREATNNIDYSSYMPPGISQFGTDFSSNFPAAGASSKVLDSVQQQQQQQQQPQEQPFNLDSIW
ncbi:hypothetical protein C3L33_04202, partial [Rhododendron williamsianum]